MAGVEAGGQGSGSGNAIHDGMAVNHDRRRRNEPISSRQLELVLYGHIMFHNDDV